MSESVSSSNEMRDKEMSHFFDSFQRELFSAIPEEYRLDSRQIITAGLARLYEVGYKRAIEDISLLGSEVAKQEGNTI